MNTVVYAVVVSLFEDKEKRKNSRQGELESVKFWQLKMKVETFFFQASLRTWSMRSSWLKNVGKQLNFKDGWES